MINTSRLLFGLVLTVGTVSNAIAEAQPPYATTNDIRLVLKAASVQVLPSEPLHLCVLASNVADHPVIVSHIYTPPVLSVRPEGGLWTDITTTPRGPMNLPPPTTTEVFRSGGTRLWFLMLDFTWISRIVAREAGETKESVRFRERSRAVFEKTGIYEVRAQWTTCERGKGDTGSSFSIKRVFISEAVKIEALAVGKDDEAALELVSRDPAVCLYFGDIMGTCFPITDTARKTAEDVILKQPNSIYADYCHFALALDSRIRGKPGWEEEANRHYAAVLKAGSETLKPRALVHLAEIEQKRDRKKAMDFLTEAASLNPGCYYGHRIDQLKESLKPSPPRVLGKLQVPPAKLSQCYTVEWIGESPERAVREFARGAGFSPDPTKAYFDDGLAGSTTNLTMYCNLMPLKYMLSWLGQLNGLKYEIESGVEAADCFKETEGAWWEGMVRKLDQPISISSPNVPFHDFIRMMAKLAGVSIVVDPSVMSTPGRPLNLSIDAIDEKAAEVLTKALNQAKCRWKLQGHAVYVFP